MCFPPIDAYARVAFCKQSAVTAVLTQTLCPTWDQTLIFDEIEIYEGVENVAKNPPSVVVELFDRDSVVRFVFPFTFFVELSSYIGHRMVMIEGTACSKIFVVCFLWNKNY